MYDLSQQLWHTLPCSRQPEAALAWGHCGLLQLVSVTAGRSEQRSVYMQLLQFSPGQAVPLQVSFHSAAIAKTGQPAHCHASLAPDGRLAVLLLPAHQVHTGEGCGGAGLPQQQHPAVLPAMQDQARL